MVGSRIDQAQEKAQVLHATGVQAENNGQLVKAARLFRRALAALGLDDHGQPVDGTSPPARDHDRLAARILLSLSVPSYELGHKIAGLEVLDDAERVATRGKFPDIQVLVLAQHGYLLLRSGRPADALVHLDRATRLLRHASPTDQCKIVINRGEVHHILAHIQLAKADFSRAADIARRHHLSEFEFGAVHNLGFMEYLSGDLPRALDLMPRVDDATTDFQRGVVGMDRSKVLLSAGLFTEADRTLVQACEALQRTDLVQFLAEAELTRAEAALLAGKTDLARTLSRRAASRFRRRGNQRSTALAELVTLEAEAASQHPKVKLGRLANELAERLEDQQLADKARMAQLIAVEATLAGHPSSIKLTDAPRPRAGEPINLRLHVRLVRAKMAFARQDGATGRREVRTGLDELSAYQAGFGSSDLQTASAAHGVGLAALGVGEALAANRPTAVFNLLERVRAISGRVPSVRPPKDEKTAELLSQLRWVIAQQDEATRGTVSESLRRQRRQLEQEIRGRSWTLQGPRAVSRPADTGLIRSSLGDATMVVIFALHRHVHGLVLTGHGCSVQPLTELDRIDEVIRRVNADLDVLALDYVPDPLRASAKRSLFTDLDTLGRLLLSPLRLPDGPVVLLPPGLLAALPWGHLPSMRSRPVSVAPTASAWLAAKSRLSDAAGRVLAVAGPGLSRAGEEVASVARSWPGCEVLADAAATGEAVLKAADGAKLVHLAAHGHHERDSPLFSSLRLFGGPVVAYELDGIPTAPEQVVLSSCDLGQATVRPGDEALGLTRALLHSGTSTVIAGVAKVSDSGAAELMSDYHRRLSTGFSPAVALADSLAAAADPLPFVCFGAG